jgi:hypothetical protein
VVREAPDTARPLQRHRASFFCVVGLGLGLGLGLGGVAEAACPTPVSPTTLNDTMKKAEAAYADLDVDSFEGAMAAGRAQLPCLDGRLPTAISAYVHRMEGLRRYTNREPDLAREAWATARELEPLYAFPTSLIPAKHVIRDAYTAASPLPGVATPVPAPAAGSMLFDGTPGTARPPGRATIFQVLGADGKTIASAYLFTADATPAHASPAATTGATAVATTGATAPTSGHEGKKPRSDKKSAAAPLPVATSAKPAEAESAKAEPAKAEPAKVRPAKGERSLVRPVLLSTAAAAAVAGGSFYALSFVPRRQFDEGNPSDTLEDLERYQSQARNRTFAAAGFGTVAAGLVVGGVLVGSW